MHFQMTSTLKSNRNHTSKACKNYKRRLDKEICMFGYGSNYQNKDKEVKINCQ
jgi:hypothetical protein